MKRAAIAKLYSRRSATTSIRHEHLRCRALGRRVRDEQAIAAVISMEGWRALRTVAQGVVEQLGEGRLRVLVGE